MTAYAVDPRSRKLTAATFSTLINADFHACLEDLLRRDHAALFLGPDKDHASGLVSAGSCGPKYPSGMEAGFQLRQMPSAAEASVHAIAPID